MFFFFYYLKTIQNELSYHINVKNFTAHLFVYGDTISLSEWWIEHRSFLFWDLFGKVLTDDFELWFFEINTHIIFSYLHIISFGCVKNSSSGGKFSPIKINYFSILIPVLRTTTKKMTICLSEIVVLSFCRRFCRFVVVFFVFISSRYLCRLLSVINDLFFVVFCRFLRRLFQMKSSFVDRFFCRLIALALVFPY